ncbi:MAG TPA: hypothetical protein VGN82_09635 [Bosea sp. (in: a-proteobacteria)]|jgi:hypothetical protein|uniref:hypothetical protein n=1 Tax=Bosea sp. (in: a-proteobacteria) TaxID=1871050 RepID=UPI002E153FB6|nr:hypothetical protein [Bosea sp. (in: a-proteobacteria)]
MKAIPLSITLEIARSVALAQDAPDPMAHLRACAVMEPAARLECLDKLSRSIAPTERSVRTADNWVVSETTSPIDYTPIITATTFSRGGSQNALTRLTIYCRGGRTELAVSGPAVAAGSTDSIIVYRINDAQPLQVAAAAPSFGPGAAFRADVVNLLQSLPDAGGLNVRLESRAGATHEGQFALTGLKAVRDRVATACKWPNVTAKPSNR